VNRQVSIALVGIPEREKGYFSQVVRFSKNRRRAYELRGDSSPRPADLVVADDEASALAEAQKLVDGRSAVRLVVVSDSGTSSQSTLVLKRPLLISRVLRVLDQASAGIPESPPVMEQSTLSIPEAEPKRHQASRVTPAEAEGFKNAVQRPTSEAATDFPPLQEGPKPGFKALVVDDSLAIRKQLEIELGEAGIAADYAETGERALEMVDETRFDLVFLDIMMPGIDGYQVCKTLRKTSEHKKTPIIMLSGRTSPLDEVQGVLAGATTYLTKPVDHDGFQTVLGRVVKWLGDYRPSV